MFDEILKYDRVLDEMTGKTGIDKKQFYRIISSYKVYLSEEEKNILNAAFEYTNPPSIIDTHKFLNMFEINGLAENQQEITHKIYTIDWERRIYRKIGDYLRKKGKTLADCFYDLSENGFVAQEDLANVLKGFEVKLNDDEITTLMGLAAVTQDGMIKIKEFTKKFYDAYLLDVFF